MHQGEITDADLQSVIQTNKPTIDTPREEEAGPRAVTGIFDETPETLMQSSFATVQENLAQELLATVSEAFLQNGSSG